MKINRSVLRVRTRDHINPERAGETIIEVLRDGEVIGTIYGTREGVQVVSPFMHTMPYMVAPADAPPGIIVPLLRPGEPCPWCEGEQIIDLGSGLIRCPVCIPI